jgi:hypothetical protein
MFPLIQDILGICYDINILILYNITCRFVTFLKFIYDSSSSILPFKYSLYFFLYILIVSCLKFCRLSLLTCFGFCNHCNLACFRWSINFELSSSNHGLLFFNNWYHRFSLAEVLKFSLILSQALLMLKLSSKLSKDANLFEIPTWFFSLNSNP